MSVITYERDGALALLTLNRPERGNGLTRELIAELERHVERADLDPEVRVLLLAGAGKGFCGGYDLVQSAEGQGSLGDEERRDGTAPPGSPLDPAVMMANHDPRGTWDPMVDHAMMSRNVRSFMSLFHCSKPVICKVHGFCVAGGTDLALCSDLLVIAADAKIGYPPARVWGSPTTSLWAYRLGPQRAKRLLFTGDCLSGTEAEEWGLAIEAPAPEKLDARARGARRADRDDAAQPAPDDEAARQPVPVRAGTARHAADRDGVRRDHPAHVGGLRLPGARGRARGSRRPSGRVTNRSEISARRPTRDEPHRRRARPASGCSAPRGN